MLSPDDRRRIEEEERYRALVRQQLGPVETTSFINRLVKFAVKAYALFLGLAICGTLIMSAAPKKTDTATPHQPLNVGVIAH